ncbi:MAG: NADPH azoreductase [Acidobacteria bacterium ADurb.Bin340]|nr:MAG: NADPH azoreductase [Acidobacteria bacterium ADurb.Bin340]
MKLVFLGGSLRPASLNRRLLQHLARQAEARGHFIQCFVGEDLRLPLYEDDLPTPAVVLRMAEAFREAQGAVIVSPEYNAGIPGHLKNAVDWLSVQKPSPWTGLPVLLAAASPGAFGGSRGLMTWRATLANLGAWGAPGALTIPRAHEALDAEGAPVEARYAQEALRVLEGFLESAARLDRG